MAVVIPRCARRTHSGTFKQSVISACSEPGVSMTCVALVNGLNANQVRCWIRECGVEPPTRRRSETVTISGEAAGFVPIALAPAGPESPGKLSSPGAYKARADDVEDLHRPGAGAFRCVRLHRPLLQSTAMHGFVNQLSPVEFKRQYCVKNGTV